MKNVAALLLAGGKMGDYGVLTQNRAKGALTFAGLFRIVDFALSNLVNAGINQIGLIIQYLPGSLIEHVGSGHPWDLDNYGKSLKIMPPFVGVEHTVWYKGTADALFQNLNFVRDHKAEHVIVLSGEHAFQIDFRDVMDNHLAKNADITVVTKELSPAQLKQRFGYVQVDDSGRITRYDEKPDNPTSSVAATGIYVFKAAVLHDLLSRHRDGTDQNLAKDILEPHCHGVQSFEYRMSGPWEYLETVRDYFDVQMQLLNGGRDCMCQWNIMTNLKFRCVGHLPAAVFGKNAQIQGGMISPGCDIQGTVINSILSPGVKVAAGAVVSNSILLHDCMVESGALLEHVISDRDVIFGADCVLGKMEAGEPGDDEYPLTLIGKAAHIGEGIVITPGRQIRPGKVLSTQEAANVDMQGGA